ncbi:MAG TPA: DUF2807 domain-containing protein [Janthinobacterium sp.]|nr:DUF2807 domain-containing protein [Janthinobacterium sp.]
MNKLFAAALMFLCATLGTNANADSQVSESRNIDARTVKIVLDGIVDLKLKQGTSASLVIYGEKRYIDKVRTTQSGDTMQIGSDIRGEAHFGSHQLRAELTLPALQELVSGGVGAADVRGFSGKELALALNGAGAVTVSGNYRNIRARLAGVGGMTVNNGDSDSVDLNLRGAGQIAVTGQSKLLHARLGGIGNLDAEQLHADSVEVEMTGLGSASVYAKNSANLHLSGMGSATVYGNPAKRSASTGGMGSVSWQ